MYFLTIAAAVASAATVATSAFFTYSTDEPSTFERDVSKQTAERVYSLPELTTCARSVGAVRTVPGFDDEYVKWLCPP